jgi:hypothetical protein
VRTFTIHVFPALRPVLVLGVNSFYKENWLPIKRKHEEIGPIMRIYLPELKK